MVTFGFLADGLLSETNKGNQLDKYCKLEGMDYQHLASEFGSLKSLLGKRKYSRIEPVNSSRVN